MVEIYNVGILCEGLICKLRYNIELLFGKNRCLRRHNELEAACQALYLAEILKKSSRYKKTPSKKSITHWRFINNCCLRPQHYRDFTVNERKIVETELICVARHRVGKGFLLPYKQSKENARNP